MELEFKTYRRRPVTMEAVELTDELHTFMVSGVVPPSPFKNALVAIKIGDYTVEARTDAVAGSDPDCYFLINTLEDVDEKTLHRAEIGDYLVKGVNGEIWAVKPEIFHKTYEEI